MANKVIITAEEMGSNLVASTEAVSAYKWALAHAGLEMDESATADFIATRNNMINGFTELTEFKAWCEKTAESIKEVLKHTFNFGDAEQLPKNVKWGKQTFTTTFANPQAAVFKLIETEGTPMENFVQWVTPKQAAEAAGITDDRLRATLGDMIIDTPKARTLSIK